MAQGDPEGFVAQRRGCASTVSRRPHPAPDVRRRWRRITEQRLADFACCWPSASTSPIWSRRSALDAARAQAQGRSASASRMRSEALPDRFAPTTPTTGWWSVNHALPAIYERKGVGHARRCAPRMLRYCPRAAKIRGRRAGVGLLEERTVLPLPCRSAPSCRSCPATAGCASSGRRALGGVGWRVDVTDLVQRESSSSSSTRLAESARSCMR